MQTAVGETTYPVMGAIKWHKTLLRPARHARSRSRDLVNADARRSCCSGSASTCGVFFLVMAPFGVFATWWGPLLALARRTLLVGMAFAHAGPSRSAPMSRAEASFGLIFRLGLIPLFLFSGAFFPISNLGPVLEWVARLHPAVARRQPDPDALPRPRRLGDWPRSTSSCWSCVTVVGWWLALRTLDAEAGD